ncbi:MAG: PAS domain S-box protein [Desulfobulbaceae bacterium]|nr:PAS domain S-box protein [Desulfobulbaceae bacterium]
MPTSPSVNRENTRHSIPLLLGLIAAGLAGNYFKFQIFLNIDFLFGSIFAMLALQFFGLGRGILAAAMIAGYTYFSWNHPYAIIIMTAEVAVVGWLMQRRQIAMVMADTLYWLIIGMPLVYLFYHVIMQVPQSNAFTVMTKQAMNGIANALVARLLFTVYSLQSRLALTSYKDISYNILGFFVLCPTLILLAIGSRSDFQEMDRDIRKGLLRDSKSIGNNLEVWLESRQKAIINLAEMAASRTPQEMQPFLELTKKSDVNFLRVGLLDRNPVTTAYFPLTDEQGASALGIPGTDRPYLAVLKQSMKPMFSEVLMGRIGIPKPRIFVLAPVAVGGEFAGYTIGVLSLEQIGDHLKNSTANTTILYTLLDKDNQVIMSNRPDQTIMTPFVRSKGTLNPLDAEIHQWMPDMPANTPHSTRWNRSYYVAETAVGSLVEWKLILEQPMAPFQKMLYDNYTGKLTLLSLIFFGALMLAQFISRRSIATLDKLRLITHNLPKKLATDGEDIPWPESGVAETKHLIDDFQGMATSLSAQFKKIRQLNVSLEQRVVEATAELRAGEAKHRAAYNLLRLMCDNVPDMIWAKDLEKRFLFANKAICANLLGAADTDEPIGKLDMFFAERERTQHADNPEWHTFGEICRDTDAITMEAGSAQQFDEYGNIQGKFLFLDVHKAPFIDETGRMIGTVGSARDVTAIKSLEKQLKMSEDQLRTLVQAIPDLIWLKNPDGVYLDCNPKFEQFFGAAQKDIIGKTDFDFVSKELADFFRENDQKAVEAGKPVTNEEWITFADDGHQAFMETLKTPILDSDGTLFGVLGIARDITERKQAEQAAKDSEARFRSLMENIDTVAIQGYGPDGTTQYWNKASERLYGYNQQEAIGCNLLDLIIPSEMKDNVAKAIREMAESCQPIPSGELLLMHKDGSRVPVISHHAIVKVPGREQEIFCLDVDISERKRAEDALQDSLAEKEVLLREVHHRVKNNMAAIIALFNLQRQAMEDPQVQAALAELSSRVRAMSLVHEKLYRSESLAKIDFQDYLQSLISHLRTSFGSPNIKCEIAALGVELPLDLAVPCGMIINELVINALKHAFPKNLTRMDEQVDTITVAVYRDHDTFSLCVADNGVGLPPAFDLNSAETLGLVLVRMLGGHQLGGVFEIEQMGGTRVTLKFSLHNGRKTHA